MIEFARADPCFAPMQLMLDALAARLVSIWAGQERNLTQTKGK